MRIRILVTGGTFDKEYDELTGRLFFRDTHLPEMLRRGRCLLDVAAETVMMIDSLELDDAGTRSGSWPGRATARRPAVVITHGTDTMVQTARALADAGLDRKTIVLTGAMVPYAFGSSDGLFNLGSALSFVQVLPPGVYIAMNGQHFPGTASARTRRTAASRPYDALPFRLESRLPNVGTTIFTVMSKLATDLGAINLSQGFPDFDCDPALVDARRPGTCGRAATSTRRCRASRRCGRRSPPSTSCFTAAATIRTPRSRSPPAAPRRSSMPSPRSAGPGDEVIVLEPCYDCYVPAIELSGATPVVVALQLPDYRLDWHGAARGRDARARG